MKLMSLKQYMKMSKPALIRKITKTLTAMPKVKLARICYNITKSKLPRLRTIRQKALPRRKTKRKFSRPSVLSGFYVPPRKEKHDSEKDHQRLSDTWPN